MQKTIGIMGRGLACVLTLAALAACNDERFEYRAPTPGALTPPGPPVSGNIPPGATPPASEGSANAAPQIAGKPRTEVPVGQTYSFKPSATDPDGDTLTFAISSKPAWASFNRSTGRLYGTPGPQDLGSHEEIRITVSDGETKRALPEFVIDVVEQGYGSVTLAWQPPTENTDGSPIVSLGGYRIHYGTRSKQYDEVIAVRNPGVTRYVLENLSPGTYYFAVTAVTEAGTESDLSGEASKTI